MGPRTRALWTIGSLLLATSAHADARVFERGRDPETGEIPQPRDHRYVDLTAFLQPGLLVRFADEGPLLNDTDELVLHRARLGIDASPVWWARLKLEADLAEGSFRVTDAFVELRPHPAVHLTLGRMPAPFLLAYRFHESNLGFADRPLYTPLAEQRAFLATYAPRDLGARVSGRIGDLEPGAHGPVFEYALAAMMRPQPGPRAEDGSEWIYAGRVALHALGLADGEGYEGDLARNTVPRVTVAGGVYSGCERDWARGFTADLEVRWQGLYVSGAYVWSKNGPAADDQLVYGRCADGATGNRTVAAGAHAHVAYVLPELLFPVRGQALELMARFDWVQPEAPFDPERRLRGGTSSHPDYVAPSTLDGAGGPERHRWSFGLTWHASTSSPMRVHLVYQHHREAEDVTGLPTKVRNDVLWLQITAGI
jgi:hypothetical protein